MDWTAKANFKGATGLADIQGCVILAKSDLGRY